MNTHDFDGVSFFTGLVFAAIGLLYLIPRDISSLIDLVVGAGSWFWPVVLLAIGVAVLVPAIRRAGSTYSESEDSTRG